MLGDQQIGPSPSGGSVVGRGELDDRVNADCTVANGDGELGKLSTGRRAGRGSLQGCSGSFRVHGLSIGAGKPLGIAGAPLLESIDRCIADDQVTGQVVARECKDHRDVVVRPAGRILRDPQLDVY